MSPADRIRELAAMLEGTSIVALDLTGPGETIQLRRDVTAAGPAAGPAIVVASPSVGRFRTHHPSASAPLCHPGERVAAGAVLGLLQIGPLYVHVRAPRAGTIGPALAADGDAVGYGTPLFDLQEQA